MAVSKFAQLAEAALCSIQDALDQASARDAIDCDCEREGAVLRLSFADGSRMVINLQPALEELWVASRRGGYHFRLNAQGHWTDTREGGKLGTRLAEEIAHHSGVKLDFAALSGAP